MLYQVLKNVSIGVVRIASELITVAIYIYNKLYSKFRFKPPALASDKKKMC